MMPNPGNSDQPQEAKERGTGKAGEIVKEQRRDHAKSQQEESTGPIPVYQGGKCQGPLRLKSLRKRDSKDHSHCLARKSKLTGERVARVEDNRTRDLPRKKENKRQRKAGARKRTGKTSEETWTSAVLGDSTAEKGGRGSGK